MSLLIEQFIAEEVTPYVHKLIVDAVAQHEFRPDGGKTRFEFNRFELTIDYADEAVVIEDVLDASSAGEVRIALGEFMRALGD